jgi:biotin transport system substrate-specific component
MVGDQNPTLVATLWPRDTASRVARAIALVFGGAVVLTLAAKVQVPFYPVPMTLQSLAVFTIGAIYGARLAGATLAFYIAEGLFGLPVFAKMSAGPAYMAGPTGGYLAGFLVAAVLVGWLAERSWDRSPARLSAALVLGEIAILALGFGWMARLFGAQIAWASGVAPFLLGDAVKIMLAAGVVTLAWRGVAALRGAKS